MQDAYHSLVVVMVCVKAYLCATWSWIALCMCVLNHGTWGRTPAYLRVIRIAVCEDNDMGTLPTIWDENPHVQHHAMCYVVLCAFFNVVTFTSPNSLIFMPTRK